MKIKLKGDWETRKVWLDGKELSPERSFEEHTHSPDGFAWGYSGSGPSQLALAICLEIYPLEAAKVNYMPFKFKFIAPLPQSGFEKELEVWDK